MANTNANLPVTSISEIDYNDLPPTVQAFVASRLGEDECIISCTCGFYKSFLGKPVSRSFSITNEKLIIYCADSDESINAVPSIIHLQGIRQINKDANFLSTKHHIDIEYEIEQSVRGGFRLDFASNENLRNEFYSRLQDALALIKNEESQSQVQSTDATSELQNHVVFSNVIYYDSDEGKEFSAKVDLFGHNIEILTYDNGNPQKRIRIEQNPEVEAEYKIISCENDLMSIDLFNDDAGSYIRISSSDFDLLKVHYDRINDKFLNWRKEFHQQIIEKLPLLLNDDELVQMAENLLDDNPRVIYLDPENIISIEHLIENDFNYGNIVFLSTEIQRSNVIYEEVTVKQGVTWHSKRVKNGAVIYPYMKESFWPFVKIVDKRFSFDYENQTSYLVHLLLVNVAIDHYAQEFSLHYSDYYADIDNLSTGGALVRYCSIETIVPENIETFGTFVYYLIYHDKLEDRNFIKNFASLSKQLRPLLEEQKLENFAKRLKRSNISEQKVPDFDLMTGQEFEQFLAQIFIKMGYEVAITKASGDQGVDIIASKDGKKLGIQAKRYSGSVGNSAIQEAVAGKTFYHLDKVMVITNSVFTNSAKELADANQVILWDRNILKEKMAILY